MFKYPFCAYKFLRANGFALLFCGNWQMSPFIVCLKAL